MSDDSPVCLRLIRGREVNSGGVIIPLNVGSNENGARSQSDHSTKNGQSHCFTILVFSELAVNRFIGASQSILLNGPGPLLDRQQIAVHLIADHRSSHTTCDATLVRRRPVIVRTRREICRTVGAPREAGVAVPGTKHPVEFSYRLA
jgi:hypothetical protein